MAEIYMKNIRDWNEATLLMNFEQKGYFQSLVDLIYLYDDVLEDNDELICRALGCSKTIHKRLKKSLLESGVIEIKNGQYFNARCSEEIKKINKISEKNRKKSEKRWKKFKKSETKLLEYKETSDADGDAVALLKVNSEEYKEKTSKSDFKILDHFEFQIALTNWMEVYPKKGSPRVIQKALQSALERISLDDLMNATKAYAKSVEDQSQNHIKSPKNFLDNDGWFDPLRSKDPNEKDFGDNHDQSLEQQRGLVEVWLKGKMKWRDDLWGAAPDQPDTIIDKSIIEELINKRKTG